MTAAHRKQQGAVLLVSLVLLLMLTIMAITVASNSSLQQRMSANAQDQNLAFHTAETAMARWNMWFEATANAPATQGAINLPTATVVSETEIQCLQSIKFTCHHITATATTANATAVHRMGYLVRDMSENY
jgi:Tfp pilus assembly protein PilX